MINSTLEIGTAAQFSRDNVIFNGMGTNGTIKAATTGIVDLLVADDHYLTGGQLLAKGGLFGDTCTMQVFDKDNVYKNSQIPGQPPGVLWYMAPTYPLMAQFMTNCQIIESTQRQMDFDLQYVAKIYGGTYLRMVYKSNGMVDVQLGANFMLHKCKY